MLIGYDASRISVKNRTGTEAYSYHILKEMLAEDDRNQYRLYVRSRLLDGPLQAPNAQQRLIGLPRLWTQAGLAWEALKDPPSVLFIPAHTMPIMHRPGLKTVVTIHDLGAEYLPQYHQFPQKYYLNSATEYAAAHASHLIAVSEFTKQDLINKLHVPAERITVVYEGVDLEANRRPFEDQITSIKAKYKLDRPYIIFIGTIQPRKNLARLIEALALAGRKDVDLVLAGGKGWLSEEIYEAPAKYGVSDQVKFLGYIDELDKPGLLAGAQASCLVSLFEGFGLPVLESMAVGTPVLAAQSSSLPEVVGESGLLVDPYDARKIADGISRILDDQPLRRNYINTGYAQAAKFSWTEAAQGTLAVLEAAAGASS